MKNHEKGEKILKVDLTIDKPTDNEILVNGFERRHIINCNSIGKVIYDIFRNILLRMFSKT